MYRHYVVKVLESITQPHLLKNWKIHKKLNVRLCYMYVLQQLLYYFIYIYILYKIYINILYYTYYYSIIQMIV